MNEEEQRLYEGLKGTIERSGKSPADYTDTELSAFFKATPPQIKELRTNKESLERYKKALTNWLSVDDLEIIDIVLAGMVAEKVGGDPLWLFLIAPPGGSKTELLRSFSNPKYFHHLSDMTSKTLVSGLMINEEPND